MKILLMSDTHGNRRALQKAIEQYGSNADVIVHCGDGTRGEAEEMLFDLRGKKTVVCVKGNCDFFNLPDMETLELSGHKIFVTHGHLFGAKYGLERLSYKAEEIGADMVFFGHTHIQTDERVGNVRLINPGSCGPYSPECAVVELDEKGNVLVNFLRVKM